MGRCRGQRDKETEAKRNRSCDEMMIQREGEETNSQEKGSQSEADTGREANADRWQELETGRARESDTQRETDRQVEGV